MAAIARKITQFTKSDIEQLWKNVHPVLRHKGFLLLCSNYSQPSLGRILIVIPKKIGNAPLRNKLRRQIKSIFYENKLYQKGFTWIFLAKAPLVNLNFKELETILQSAMSDPSPGSTA